VREWGLVLSILVVAAIFDPLKRRIQGWVDKAFDRHRYDYRKALVNSARTEFGDQSAGAARIDCRAAARTLLVARVAVFLTQDSGRVRLAASHGLPAETHNAHEHLALGFLDFDRPLTTRTFF